MRRGKEAIRYGERLIDVAREQAFFFWETTGMLFLAGGLNCEGNYEEANTVLQTGLARYHATGARLSMSQYLSFLAETQMNVSKLDESSASLDAAVESVREHANRFHEPELYRLRGIIAMKNKDLGSAEQQFRLAFQTARRDQSLAWELAARIELIEHCPSAGDTAESVSELRKTLERIETCDVSIPVIRRAHEILEH